MKWFVFATMFCLISAGSFFCIANDDLRDGVSQPDLAVPLYRYYDNSTVEDEKATDSESKGNEDFQTQDDKESELKEERIVADKLWTRKLIEDIRINIRETHEPAPVDRSGELDYGGSDWSQFVTAPKVFAWAAPDIRYQPLYFEDVALERYGQTRGLHLQPYRSGLHFFKSFVFLPNQMRHDHPCSCDYPLGFCRPGTCVPGIRQQQFFGFSTR